MGTSKSGLPKVLILCGDGINCERETASAFEAAGFIASITHVNELVSRPGLLTTFQAFGLPGGFSFGDELGSGQILADKLRRALDDHLNHFVALKKPVIGICNGFQTLVKLGVLPGASPGALSIALSDVASPRVCSLAHNSSGQFINRWIDVEFPESVCIWTKTFEGQPDCSIQFPVRHGEGRVVAQDESGVLKTLKSRGQIPIRYRQDFNGSMNRIAGLCDPTGVVFGLMPHPEAAVFDWLHPSKRTGSARGLDIFKNARRYIDEN